MATSSTPDRMAQVMLPLKARPNRITAITADIMKSTIFSQLTLRAVCSVPSSPSLGVTKLFGGGFGKSRATLEYTPFA